LILVYKNTIGINKEWKAYNKKDVIGFVDYI
jgi:hypothetical protein